MLAFATLFVATSFMLFASCHGRSVKERTYRLHYLPGATGLFMYVDDGGEKYFNFDPEHSSALALSAWSGLKWNILYPNSDGGVAITGILDEKRNLFLLRKWVLQCPFTAWELDNPDDMPQSAVPISRTGLRCNDFEGACPDRLETYVDCKKP